MKTLLRLNLQRARGAGQFDVAYTGEGSRRFRRKLIQYCLALAIVDVPLAFIAGKVGHGDPFGFVFALSGIALFTSWLTWFTWMVRPR